MSKWFDIRVKTEAARFNDVRSKIMGWPSEVAREIYWPALEQIGEEGRDFIRNIVATDTNTKKYRETGEAGRIDSRTLYNKVQSRPRVRSNNAFSLFVGWIRGEPGYAIFQELGTKNGVRAMNAIGQAEEMMLTKVRMLGKGTYKGRS